MKPTEPLLKLIQEVETRWNSTFHMLQRMYYLREAVGAALAGLHTDITPLTSHQLRLISESLQVLSPFNDAAVELSEEKSVSGSKVIPLLAMLHHTLEDDMGAIQMEESKAMAEGLKKQLRDKLYNLQAMSVMSLATLLDHRFKKIGFFSPNKAQEAERRLTAECAAVIRHRASSSSSNPSSSSTQPDTSEGSQPVEQGDKLWRRLDHTVMQRRTQSRTQSESADATVEGHTYLGEPNTSRKSNPLGYWEQHKHINPNLYKLLLFSEAFYEQSKQWRSLAFSSSSVVFRTILMHFYHVVATLGYSTAMPEVPAARALRPEVPADDGVASAPDPHCSRPPVPLLWRYTTLSLLSGLRCCSTSTPLRPPPAYSITMRPPPAFSMTPRPPSAFSTTSRPPLVFSSTQHLLLVFLATSILCLCLWPLLTSEVSEVAPLPAPLDAATDLVPAPPEVSKVTPLPALLAAAANLAPVPAPLEASKFVLPVALIPSRATPTAAPVALVYSLDWVALHVARLYLIQDRG
ncbi:uncharacterized protein LOC130921551 [Corythoichthys intestinalis]|uniref:uncharacterized protein LOC130921551 n=1 Tax=Corythoichthys intestinalis TaxID=161448 RepID=UPI0025A569B6|nr:uncharacterized protein LOC130921551 [Corythoichthys intestinalis]